MKTILYTLLITLLFVSCKKEQKVDYTVISGTILNGESKNLRLSGLNNSFNKTIDISEKGTFNDTLNVDAGHYMIFTDGGVVYLYLEPSYSLNLSLNVKDYSSSIKFSGEGSEINNYLVAKRKKQHELEGKNVFEVNEADFKKLQNDIRTVLIAFLSTQNELPESYKKKEKRNIKYTYLNKLNDYEFYHAHYTKNPDFKVSEEFLKEGEELDYNNEEDYFFSYGYANLVGTYYNEQAEKIAESESIPHDVALMKAIGTATNDSIKNTLLYKKAQFGVTYTSDIEAYYTAFMEASTNQKHKDAITENYTILRTTSKGKPSPKFVDYKNNAGGTTSLDDLKGKYVYIDVWATWCAPCKAEIPFLKEVEQKYHDKNIEFVSISIDSSKDHDKWKKMVADMELGGIQLMADNDFKSKFVEEYFIKGIPKFILLDPDGIIINPNAPRPSDDKLIDLFNQLNI